MCVFVCMCGVCMFVCVCDVCVCVCMCVCVCGRGEQGQLPALLCMLFMLQDMLLTRIKNGEYEFSEKVSHFIIVCVHA